MAQQGTDVTDLITRLRQGDRAVLGQLFSMFSERLLLMVRLRIDCRLRARVTESDVLQESFLEATKRIAEFLEQSKTPFYLWVRFLTLQQLAIHRRRHLRVQSRTVDREADLELAAVDEAEQSVRGPPLRPQRGGQHTAVEDDPRPGHAGIIGDTTGCVNDLLCLRARTDRV